MTASTTTNPDNSANAGSSASSILHQKVLGSRRFSNYWWATVVSIGATGFLLAALSSYFKVNLLPFADLSEIVFIPQGLAMGFYGVAGLLLALYLWTVTILDVGAVTTNLTKRRAKSASFAGVFRGRTAKLRLTPKWKTCRLCAWK